MQGNNFIDVVYNDDGGQALAGFFLANDARNPHELVLHNVNGQFFYDAILRTLAGENPTVSNNLIQLQSILDSLWVVRDRQDDENPGNDNPDYSDGSSTDDNSSVCCMGVDESTAAA